MRTVFMTFAAAAVSAFSVPAHAQTMQNATITMVRTGWNADSFAIVTAEPIQDPARCGTADGYISAKSMPGYETYYAAALTALVARRRVVITMHDTECYEARPKLIGINVMSSN